MIAAEKVLVDDSFDWFVALVEERRKIGDNAMTEIKRGGVFTGRMALERGLVDGLGGLDEARAWLLAEHDVNEALDLTPYAVPEYAPSPLDFLFGEDARAALDVLDLRARLAPGLWAIYR